MRAYLKKQKNLLSIPSDFAKLQEVTKDGFYVYKVQYWVNPQLAVQLRAFTTDILFSHRPIVGRQVKLFNDVGTNDTDQIIQNIRFQKQQQRALQDATNKEILYRYVSDITKNFPNTSLNSLTVDTILKKLRTVSPQQVAQLRGNNFRLPVLENVKQTNQKDLLGVTNFSQEKRARDLLLLHKIDPASLIGEATNSIISAKQAIDGTISSRTKTLDAQDQLLINEYLENGFTNINSQAELSDDDVMNVSISTNVKHVIVEETLRIPRSIVTQDDFYLTFRIKNNRGIIQQTGYERVPHKTLEVQHEIPVDPPELIVPKKARHGNVLIRCKQRDPNATDIILLKKEVRKFDYQNSSNFTFLTNIKATVSDGIVIYKDYSSSTEPVIYRAIAVNRNGITSGEFESKVVETDSNFIGMNHVVAPYETRISIDDEVAASGITLKVTDFSPNVISTNLQRRNLSLKEQSWTNVGVQQLIQTTSKSPLVYIDTSIKQDMIYEYRILLHMKGGSAVPSTTTKVVPFRPIDSNVIDLQTTTPEVIEDGLDIDVKFSVVKNIDNNNTTLIKNYLEQQGFISEFQDEVLANRENLDKIFGVSVTRTNLSTGEKESFGLLTSDDFSDKDLGPKKSVKPLKPGFEYKYTITAFGRDIASVLPTLEQTKQVTSNVDYTFKPYKWNHPITLNRGNIVTDESLKRNYAYEAMSFGNVVDQVEVFVNLEDVLPSLYDGKAKSLNNGKNLVQWKVQGDVSKIDHFVVVLETLGLKTIVGKCHNLSKNNLFQFVDKLTNKESGGLTYYIVPVYFDYSKGTVLKTNKIVI